MRTFILALAFLFSFACSSAAPVAPAAPSSPRNAAVDYAHTLAADVQCMPLSTAQADQPDTAVCDFAQILAYCRVGVGAGSHCAAFADLRPKQPAPAEPDAKPTPEAADDKAEHDKHATKSKPKR